ncbi:hypothetical protein [uncultured Flavobacterium sp.]|uniref:hypothetical protein n=1 Tax=uncultured Flavobacterium sp. TaxID=165435 RepID=UPI0025E77FE1|nr:hypothetical protein [uncultured Flavobacterium sp.]
MKNFIGRNAELKEKVNKHLQKLTHTETDFYTALKQEDILELKTVLSDINNLLTFKLTLAAGNWLSEFFSLNLKQKELVLDKIDRTKPNEQGYDILIYEPIKLIAEVKCNSPVKEGAKFGAMQSKKLLEDAQKLLYGKKQLPNTDDFLKFLFVIDLGNRSHEAVVELVRMTKIRVENEERLNRNIIREHLIILDDQIRIEHLEFDKIYIKVLKLE